MRTVSLCLATLAVMSLGGTRLLANVVDDFENGANHGHWTAAQWTLEATGGNPGGWFHAHENRGEPLFTFLPDPNNIFSGDYVSKGVTQFTVDLRADAGFNQENPDGRGTVLRLDWTNNGDYLTGIEAWYTGALLPEIGTGWHSYSYPIPAASSAIPAGWTIFEGNGTPGTDADWQYLVRHIDQVIIQYGEIGYAFPVRLWDIGMDNVTLVTPEPGSALALLVGGCWLASRRRG
jgi:hypothetical protein